MSWLLAACMPGLLMLWAVGLQRLESLMHGDRPNAGQLVARLEHAARMARENAAQRTLHELSGVSPRIDPAHLLLADEPGLPTRPNPQVQPYQIANRV
ncbi:MAG TPA: hypothetical protein PKK01_10895 [Mycobacterium sp.]|nr:MAG: hypothetical protein E6Q56_07530 [Mycobacterium sp.]HOB49803.1 hypothetical protein [Mycobacterium sp.]HQE16080.1 hypothetical protein [Mycobacterium sp.]